VATLGIIKVIWPWIAPSIAAIVWLLRMEAVVRQNKSDLFRVDEKAESMGGKLDAIATDMAIVKQKLGVITEIVSPDKLTAHTERTATLMADVRHIRRDLDCLKHKVGK